MSNILIKSGDNYYFNSKNIKVYPCSNRVNPEDTALEHIFDPEARLNTENNLRKMASTATDSKESYIKKATANTLQFVISGYHFEIVKTDEIETGGSISNDFTAAFGASKVIATINLKEVTLADNIKTKVLTNLISSTEKSYLDEAIGENYCFTGVKLTVVNSIVPNNNEKEKHLFLWDGTKYPNSSFLPKITAGEDDGEVVIKTLKISSGNIKGNADTATNFKDEKTIELTGDVEGSGAGGNGKDWSIKTTLSSNIATEIGNKAEKSDLKTANDKITKLEEKFTGNSAKSAITATKAIKDGNGNNIVNTYATKAPAATDSLGIIKIGKSLEIDSSGSTDIKGFTKATEESLPQKQADGTLKWVAVSTIVEGDGNTITVGDKKSIDTEKSTLESEDKYTASLHGFKKAKDESVPYKSKPLNPTETGELLWGQAVGDIEHPSDSVKKGAIQENKLKIKNIAGTEIKTLTIDNVDNAKTAATANSAADVTQTIDKINITDIFVNNPDPKAEGSSSITSTVKVADTATNVDLSDNGSSDATVNIKVGNGKSYSHTVNNVENATNANTATNVNLTATGTDTANISIQAGTGTAAEFTVNNVAKATNADTATDVSTNINGHAINSIFEIDGTTAKVATKATNDSNGNPIASTYTKKTDAIGAVEAVSSKTDQIAVKTVSGTAKDTITINNVADAKNVTESINSGVKVKYNTNKSHINFEGATQSSSFGILNNDRGLNIYYGDLTSEPQINEAKKLCTIKDNNSILVGADSECATKFNIIANGFSVDQHNKNKTETAGWELDSIYELVSEEAETYTYMGHPFDVLKFKLNTEKSKYVSSKPPMENYCRINSNFYNDDSPSANIFRPKFLYVNVLNSKSSNFDVNRDVYYLSTNNSLLLYDESFVMSNITLLNAKIEQESGGEVDKKALIWDIAFFNKNYDMSDHALITPAFIQTALVQAKNLNVEKINGKPANKTDFTNNTFKYISLLENENKIKLTSGKTYEFIVLTQSFGSGGAPQGDYQIINFGLGYITDFSAPISIGISGYNTSSKVKLLRISIQKKVDTYEVALKEIKSDLTEVPVKTSSTNPGSARIEWTLYYKEIN